MSVIKLSKNEKSIDIDITKQELRLLQGDNLMSIFPISSAKNGIGQIMGSECTPIGLHTVRAKIGKNAKENAVFVGRRETGEIFTEELRQKFPQRDWILTRILWLSGLEKGVNRAGEVDTMRRYIYIHGCPNSDSFLTPSSHGCIKMRNKDIIDLYDNIDIGIGVFLHKG